MSDVKHPGLNLGHTDAGSHDAAEEVIFGFWIFLMSDLVLFALLFATHASMAVHGLAGGPGAADIFELRPAFLETLTLLASSFTFGMASMALKYRRNPRRLLVWMGVTCALGAIFLGMEAADLHKMAAEKGAAPSVSGYLSAVWTLLGTHFLHVAAGMVWLAVLAAQVLTLGLVREVKLRIMRLALFWHMLDVVWIGIVTFVILAGMLP